MKTSIYLPDELAEQVRVHGISISEVAQAALRQAVRAAQAKERVMSNIEAVVERLRSTVAEDDRRDRAQGKRDGIRWAKDFGTAREIEVFAGGVFDVDIDHSIIDFQEGGFEEDNHLPLNMDQAYWQGFMEGVDEVWEAVREML